MIVRRLQILMVRALLLLSVFVRASMAPALEIGEKAPDFTLPSPTGQEISLSQFHGKQPVLIEFYGQDFAPV